MDRDDDPDFDDLLARMRAADPLADPRWDALADGTLSEEEAAELRAARERGDAPPGAYEAYSPMSEERRERLLASVLASASPVKEGAAAAPPVREGAPPKRPRRAIAAGAALALAAGVALAVGLRTPESLPAYSLSFDGGGSLRATPPPSASSLDRVRVEPGTRPTIVLRPATAVSGRIEIRTFVAAGRDVADLSLDREPLTTTDGAVVLEDMSTERLRAVRAREADLVIAVARAGHMPDRAALIADIAAGATSSRGAQLLRLRVDLGEGPR